MTNKQEVKQQLEKLEAEVQKLKEIINKPEKAVSLLEDGDYYISTREGQLYAFITYSKDEGTNRFPSADIAQAYAEAFNTMLALRKCEGSCTTLNMTPQYLIQPCGSSCEIRSAIWSDLAVKIDKISPSYLTSEYAQAAIDKVGKDNIIKMFKTLHGIYV